MEWTMRDGSKGSVYSCDTPENLDSDGRSAEAVAERATVERDGAEMAFPPSFK